MSGNHRARFWHGLPREEIRWHPLVQSCLCNGCGLCVTSCPAQALSFDFQQTIPFADPLRCIVGCSTCATLCPNDAILLPEAKMLKDLIERQHIDIRARSELRRQRKLFGGVLPSLIYPDDIKGERN